METLEVVFAFDILTKPVIYSSSHSLCVHATLQWAFIIVEYYAMLHI
jgi:hypothetical protein